MKPGLRSKFLLVLIGIAILFALVIAYSYIALDALHDIAFDISERFDEFSAVLVMGIDVLNAARPIHFYPVSGNPVDKLDFEKNIKRVRLSIKEVRSSPHFNPTEDKLIDNIENALAKAEEKAGGLFAVPDPTNNPEANKLSEEADRQLHLAIEAINKYKIVETKEIGEDMEKADALRSGRGNLILSLILMMGIVIAGMVAINLNIINPILKISRGVELIGKGNLDYRLHIHTGDEIETLAETFNQMAFNLWQEEATAAEIQQRLLPQREPRPHGVRLHARQVQAKIIGGDWYDFYQLDDDLKMLIADASGKGMPGALLSTVAMSVIRSEPKSTPMIDILRKTNRTVESRLGSGDFITLFSTQLNLNNHEMNYINCGHEPPIIFDPDDESWSLLKCRSGLPLGVTSESFNPGRGVLTLKKGSKIIFYTDGLHAVKNQANQFYTIQDIITWLEKHADLSIEPMIDSLLEETLRYCRHRLLDDVTLLGFEVL